MSIVKPYTFTAGTKARADEVNDDFDVLYSQVNANISNIAQNALDIDTLDANKANINGNSTEVFNVADATTNTHAVNKQTMMSYIGNILNYIDGLKITKDNNNTIIVSAGSCYDSTHTVVLKLTANTSKQNLNQGASTTYYVYIIGNDTGSSIDILISTNSTTPTLPAGYTLFRKIGSYTTNSSSNIDVITNLSNDQSLKLSAITSKSANGYCKFSNGFIVQWKTQSGFGNGTVKTITWATPFSSTNYLVAGSANYEQSAGDKGSSWAVQSRTATTVTVRSEFEQGTGHGDVINLIATGY